MLRQLEKFHQEMLFARLLTTLRKYPSVLTLTSSTMLRAERCTRQHQRTTSNTSAPTIPITITTIASIDL